MSNVIQIQQFLLGKTFQIPPYQRDYAWNTAQVDDLLEDIQEALDTNSGHYLGTIVIAGDGTAPYEVVDGQQRLTTTVLIVHALLEELATDDRDRIADETILLRRGAQLNLDFGVNAQFVDALFAQASPSPSSAGQRKLRDAYRHARDRSRALKKAGGAALVKRWLTTIKTLELIQFVASDTGRAIRMFQTVNDRGLPLNAMDKAKALLVYYSNRFLGGALDQKINGSFGKAFAAFDFVRDFVRQPGFRVDTIARGAFTEDDLLRYHYLSYTHVLATGTGDYDGSIGTVYDDFLKRTLKALAGDSSKLTTFIDDYVADLDAFSTAFQALIAATKTDSRLYRLFVILGLGTRLYPLVIRLHQRQLLTAPVPGTSVDLLHCLEVCDVRVYKTRGTDPAKDIGDLSHLSRSLNADGVASRLKNFVHRFMPKSLFQTNLNQDMYHNDAILHILLAYDEYVANTAYTNSQLLSLVLAQPTREHIIAQTPHFSPTSLGFTDDTDYEQHLHNLGNLTLLSRSENSKCNNQPTHTKISDPNLYTASTFAGTRLLAHHHTTSGTPFDKAAMVTRTQTLAAFTMQKWATW